MTRQMNEITGGIARLMLALQFGDSLLPIGSFTLSNGLEAAVAAAGWCTTRARWPSSR